MQQEGLHGLHEMPFLWLVPKILFQNSHGQKVSVIACQSVRRTIENSTLMSDITFFSRQTKDRARRSHDTKKNYVGHFFSRRNHTRSYGDQNEPSQTKSSLRESIISTTSGRNWFMQPRTILLFRHVWRYLQLQKSKNIGGIKRYDAPKITDMRWFKIVLHW